MSTRIYDWNDAGPGEQEQMHIGQFHFRAGRTSPRHKHSGYAEATWVIDGQGWHGINDEVIPVSIGDVLFINESDSHHFIAGDKGMTVLNAAIIIPLLQETAQRLQGIAPWPWNQQGQRCVLGPGGMARLAHWAEELQPHHLNKGDVIAFLADLVRLPTRAQRRGGSAPPPPWLTGALRHWETDHHMALGPGDFAQACGYSPDHVNRAVRLAYGCTTSVLLQRLRPDRAATLLRLSDRSVLDIALTTGFSNQGHFHRCFKERFDTTPRGYRHRRRTV